MSSSRTGEAALGTRWWYLLAIGVIVVGLALGLGALLTVHQKIPFSLECNPPGPLNDPGPNPDFITPLVKGILYLAGYCGVFVLGFWTPWLFLRKRRWAPVIAGCLLAPLSLATLSTTDLLLNVAPAHGLRLHVPPSQGLWLSAGACPSTGAEPRRAAATSAPGV